MTNDQTQAAIERVKAAWKKGQTFAMADSLMTVDEMDDWLARLAVGALTPTQATGGAVQGEPVAWVPKGHLARYLKGKNTGCWVYGSPTAEDNDCLYFDPSPPVVQGEVTHIAHILEEWDMKPRSNEFTGHSYEEIATDIVNRLAHSAGIAPKGLAEAEGAQQNETDVAESSGRPWHCTCCRTEFMHEGNSRPNCPWCKAWDQYTYQGYLVPLPKPSIIPTASEINALPDKFRHYIAMLETDADPSGTIRSEMHLREQVDALETVHSAGVATAGDDGNAGERVKALPTDEQVREAMQTAWDDFCDDAQAHPDDIYREGRKTYFRAGTWADHTAMHLRAALLSTDNQPSAPIADGGEDAVERVAQRDRTIMAAIKVVTMTTKDAVKGLSRILWLTKQSGMNKPYFELQRDPVVALLASDSTIEERRAAVAALNAKPSSPVADGGEDAV